MMLPELMHTEDLQVLSNATNGIYHIIKTFSNPIYVVLYLIWLCALWFHLTHGFWSALQTLGWNNRVWFERWRCIAYIFSTVVVGCFALVVVVFYVKSLL
jgi:succinate dehydrogenase / fumarate reductase cytochrome b subunit